MQVPLPGFSHAFVPVYVRVRVVFRFCSAELQVPVPFVLVQAELQVPVPLAFVQAELQVPVPLAFVQIELQVLFWYCLAVRFPPDAMTPVALMAVMSAAAMIPAMIFLIFILIPSFGIFFVFHL